MISGPQEGHDQVGLGVVGWVIDYIKDWHTVVLWIVLERFRSQHPADANLLIIPSNLLDDYTFSVLRVSINEGCLGRSSRR